MKFSLLGTKSLNDAQQELVFSRRAMLLGGAQMGVGVLLAARMGWIAIAQNEKYSLLSESNRVNLTLIPPRRGWIIDRHGRPIASNRTDFRVDIIPDRLRDADRVIEILSGLLSLQPDDIDRIREDLDRAAGFQPVQVADGLDYRQFAAVSVRLLDLPGVAPSQGFSRHYPAGPSVGHLVGYVGAPSAEDYQKTRDPLLVTPGYKVGKQGLEQYFNARLTGAPGARRVEVTAHGRIVRDLATRPDVPGKSVRLTIDAELQHYAGRRLGTQSGAVTVIDCRNGDVLAMASMPSFDPNSFSDGISRVEWQMLSENDHVPLRNKALQGLYPPGSTVKPMIALAMLEQGLDPEATVVCRGAVRVGNTLFHCHSRRGHGAVNMRRAIAQSCNIYFYVMAQKFGMEIIAEMARRVGMGQKFPLPFPSQSYGTVPDPAWKLRKFNEPWAVYDTVNATIGQGYMLINPIQLAVMAARLASGRALMPRLVAGPAPQTPLLGVRQDHLDRIHAAMSDVVNGGGTGGAARMPVKDVLLAGKTGTAQVRRLAGSRRNRGIPFKYRDHALFQGYAPFDQPRYAVGCIIEHGGHLDRSQDAHTIASDVMSWLFDRAGAEERLATLEAGWGGSPEERLRRELAEFRVAKGLDPAPEIGNSANATDPASSTDAEDAPASEPAANAAGEQDAADDADRPPPPTPVTQPLPSPTTGSAAPGAAQ